MEEWKPEEIDAHLGKFCVGDRVKIRLVNEMDSDSRCRIHSTSTGRAAS